MTTKTISPAAQVANVARALLALAERRPHDGQLAELRKVAQHLVALADDGAPF